MKTKILVSLEILSVFVLMVVLRVSLRSAGFVQWEKQHLGWSYSVILIWIGIALLVMRLTRRSWAEFGISTRNWQTNLDIGFKAYLVRIIPAVLTTFGPAWLGLQFSKPGMVAFDALLWVIAVLLMVWLLNRQKEVKSGRTNIIATLLFLFVPVGVALALGRLSLVIVSTVVWQFVLSGFGEELIYRGYFQSRLNQVFGRPLHLFGIQFGVGLFVASLLFGLLHAFNGYDPAIGFSSLAWAPAVSSAVAGLFFGVIREKTGTLLAPGFAHGLPDAVGEGLNKIFGWF